MRSLNVHYIIALSTFTATKVNRPCLKGGIKLIYAAGVMPWLNLLLQNPAFGHCPKLHKNRRYLHEKWVLVLGRIPSAKVWEEGPENSLHSSHHLFYTSTSTGQEKGQRSNLFIVAFKSFKSECVIRSNQGNRRMKDTLGPDNTV